MATGRPSGSNRVLVAAPDRLAVAAKLWQCCYSYVCVHRSAGFDIGRAAGNLASRDEAPKGQFSGFICAVTHIHGRPRHHTALHPPQINGTRLLRCYGLWVTVIAPEALRFIRANEE
ncbi:hypothetical protein MBRA_53640 (plasmid) [Mycobacterium branderi]|uniref:Uncharacterized protein n=1 Tax=Mycobacterium branderi TaxID=43348 RepID=A0ABM7KVG0_9MYCO|nr:hypothetical protein MBRA_53640 [Mycobacterium branderi]